VPGVTLARPRYHVSRPPALAQDEIHVWRAIVPEDRHTGERFQWVLGPDERARAERFHFDRDRVRFVFRRAWLKILLARYLAADVANVRITHGRYGKPALTPSFDGADLRFNLSHSNGMVVVAIAHGREVGLDVEYIRPEVEVDAIARRIFSRREAAALAALPAADRVAAFFACWTRKEAFVKATGEGLSRPLAGFDVSLAPGEPAELLGIGENPGDALRWSLRALHPGTGYCAALAAEGHDWKVSCWDEY